MSQYVLRRTQVVPASLDDAFAFFADPYNLEAITPPWLRFRIVEAPATLESGSLIRYRLRLFGVPIFWRTEIRAWAPPHGFTDVQLRGPFRLWEHRHTLTPVEGGTEIGDEVRYGLFFGPIGKLIRRVIVGRWVESIFDYRTQAVAEFFRLKR